MSTPAIDLMSSPDPLNESIGSPVPPSTRRVTRSQASQRFMALGSSPRKQKFTLDVGNQLSPQKIRVTVEADDPGSANVSRRLFQSPTPQRATRQRQREKATTITVPLKGLTDDENGAFSRGSTPKRRPRLPKSGTPATTKPKRAATPARNTPRQPRRTRTSQNDVLTSDISVEDSQATPKATARAMNARKRKTPTPARGDDSQAGLPKKRGRPRKAIVADEIRVETEQEIPEDSEDVSLVPLGPTEDSISVASSLPPASPDDGPDEEHNASMTRTEDSISVAGSVPSSRSSNSLGGDDIWMAGLSDPPMPVRRQRPSRSYSGQPDIPALPEEREPEYPWPDLGFPEGDEALSQSGMDPAATHAPSEAQSVAGESQDHGSKDTVMLGEEFTMISIGSLPSMLANASMAAAEHKEIGDDTSLIINRTLDSVRGVPKDRENDAMEAAGYGLETTAAERSFVDPGNSSMFAQHESPQAWSRSPRRAKSQPLGRQLALKSLQRDDGLERPQDQGIETENSRKAPEDTSIYDDSFSEIPEDVLEAATPKAPRQVVVEEMDDTEDVVQPSVERPSMVTHSDPQSESNKLLTPDETPSPGDTDGERDKEHRSTSKSLAHSEMRSSPPVFGFSRQGSSESIVQHSRHTSSETPAVHPPSPRFPPRVVEAETQPKTLAPPERTPRPTLSPIVRAGRALQLVTSDPPSPPSRSSVLGSPFKGSVSKSSQSPAPTFPTVQRAPSPIPAQQPSSTQQSNKSWSKAFAPFNQIKNLVAQGAQVFSPRAPPEPGTEDPFGPSVANHGEPDLLISDVGLDNGPIARAEGGGSVTSSTRADPPSDDEMSWQVDRSPARFNGGEISGTVSSTVRGRRGSIGAPDVDVDMMGEIGGQGEEHSDAAEQTEDDEDIWAIEAQRPTPRPAKSTVAQVPVLNPPRRSKLPSPWRQNTKRLVYNDELHKDPESNDEVNPQSVEVEEFSMLSQPNSDEPSTQPRQNEYVTASRKVDLSNFFSSPALLPSVQPPGVNLFRFAQTRGFPRTQHEPVTSQPHSPQKTTSFAIPTKDSRLQPQAVGRLNPVPQKAFQIGNQPRSDLFSPVKRFPSRDEATEHLSSPVTPERQLFSHVPQKRDFTPRLRQPGNTLFDPLPGTKSSSSTNSTPVEPFSESASEVAVDTSQEGSFIPPQLKPLPSKTTSPSKSCMRSPLKPKTPGRVVEFASSTLSPLAQAQARAERRASASPEKQDRVSTPEAPDADKENHQLDMAASSTAFPSPAASSSLFQLTARSKSPTPAGPTHLSQTQWSRQHWVRLDELLQQRRRSGALQFQLQHNAVAVAAQKRRGSASTSTPLLGKLVSAQGETMALEQWHLDVVDAFGAEVGGWNEAVLAKRLFALMVGEDRRRRGEVPARRGVR